MTWALSQMHVGFYFNLHQEKTQKSYFCYSRCPVAGFRPTQSVSFPDTEYREGLWCKTPARLPGLKPDTHSVTPSFLLTCSDPKGSPITNQFPTLQTGQPNQVDRAQATLGMWLRNWVGSNKERNCSKIKRKCIAYKMVVFFFYIHGPLG